MEYQLRSHLLSQQFYLHLIFCHRAEYFRRYGCPNDFWSVSILLLRVIALDIVRPELIETREGAGLEKLYKGPGTM